MTVIAIAELEQSGKNDQELVYPVYVYDDTSAALTRGDARAAAIAEADSASGETFDDEIDEIDLKRASDHSWRATIAYRGYLIGSAPPPQKTGEVRLRVEVGSEPVTLLQHLSMTEVYYDEDQLTEGQEDALVGDPDFFKGAFGGWIGLPQDPTQVAWPTGVNVEKPLTRLVYNYRIANANVTEAYLATIESLASTVNNDTWKGRPAGSVRFDGIVAQVRNSEAWEFEFAFSVRANRSGLTFGNITGVAVDGWDFLEPRNQLVKFANGDAWSFGQPTFILIHRVYPRTDFDALAIPDPDFFE